MVGNNDGGKIWVESVSVFLGVIKLLVVAYLLDVLQRMRDCRSLVRIWLPQSGISCLQLWSSDEACGWC